MDAEWVVLKVNCLGVHAGVVNMDNLDPVSRILDPRPWIQILGPGAWVQNPRP